MTSNCPVIALTSTQTTYLGEPAVRLAENYADAVAAAGGAPVILPVSPDLGLCDRLLGIADGLLLTGGHDIDPARYRDALAREGGDPRAAEKLTVDPTPLRDAVELRLLALAEKRRMPVLGICRGLQLMNVAHGGTLYADLETQHVPPAGRLAVRHDEHMDGRISHEVGVAPNSLLACALEQDGALAVNSLHHQAVRTLGEGLVASAVSTDGVIEAAENPGHPFMLGVQWHPEYWPGKAPMAGIFHALVEAARMYANGR